MEENFSFGKQLLPLFMFQPGYINVNSGSLGSVPKQVWYKKLQAQNEMNKSPDIFHRLEMENRIIKSRQATAKAINAKLSNTFLVDNSTSAGSIFLRSLKWKQGEVLLTSNVAFVSLLKVINFLKEEYKIRVVIVQLKKQSLTSVETVVNAFKEAIQKEEDVIKFAAFDHITCSPAIVFPIEPLAELFHEKDIPFFVDGAHAIGQMDIDIEKIKPAGYCSNFHKWGFSPLSCAFLYVSQKYLNKIEAPVIGYFHGETKDRQFFWQGSKDLSTQIIVPDALKFIQKMRDLGMEEYCSKLCQEATLYLCNLLGTEPLTKCPAFSKYMNNIELPMFLQCDECMSLSYKILDEFRFWIPIGNFDGRTYFRISVQVYNDMSDFVFVGEKIKEVFQRMKKDKQTSAEQ